MDLSADIIDHFSEHTVKVKAAVHEPESTVGKMQLKGR